VESLECYVGRMLSGVCQGSALAGILHDYHAGSNDLPGATPGPRLSGLIVQ
jgi:hypothetical protein